MEGVIATGIIGLGLGAQYALLALGFTLIFGILGVVNFAHGGFYALGGYLAYAAVTFLAVPYGIAVLAAALATGALGYVFELVLVERFVNDERSTMMLTLGFYLVLTTAMHVLFGPESLPFAFPVVGILHWHMIRVPLANLVVFAVCIVSILGMYFLIQRTGLGRALRALADDRLVAMAIGIPPRRLFPFAFAIGCALAGLTGALVTPILSLSPHVGDPVLITSFLIVILGGLGSIGGATLAAFIVGLVEAYSSVYLGGSKGALVLFTLEVLILIVRPRGLLGRETRGA
jgi:branched-chain amino acid transport system permease protein